MTRASVPVKQFDVFSRAFKSQWLFSGTLEASTPEEAKSMYMRENQILNSNNVAVYQKR
jgi:hypothetical protein